MTFVWLSEMCCERRFATGYAAPLLIQKWKYIITHFCSNCITPQWDSIEWVQTVFLIVKYVPLKVELICMYFGVVERSGHLYILLHVQFEMTPCLYLLNVQQNFVLHPDWDSLKQIITYFAIKCILLLGASNSSPAF